jgi:YVTN family beta-propeller protein
VSVIDTATDAVVGRSIAVGRNPYGMGISPDGGTLYVSGFDSDEVTAVDTKANAVAWRTAVGDGPLNLAVDRDGSRVYVVNTLDDTISIVDPATRSAAPGAIAVGAKPIGIVLSPDARTLYVTERDADRVSAVSTASRTVGGSVEPGKGPVAMAVAGDRLYVVSEISGELTVLRTGPPG